MIDVGRIEIIPGDHAAGVDATHLCGLTRARTGPGASKVVMVPFAARTKPG
jgi:hypothetical protein